ncbi:MAG: IMP dehydrogenase [Candidatus Muirbacterium halophilum]|nr:IMP dehydrogenase [Candidatus Muirbacterium halophilum]
MTNLKKYKLIEIDEIEYDENTDGEVVYDLTISDDNSYTVNDYVVHNCTTSANVSIHYPLASLISECAKYKKDFEKPTKIVADGGFKNFSDIIKALALGADYVMIGSIFNKCIESCSDIYIKQDGKMVKLNDKVDFTKNIEYYKYYRGMSTKEVQMSWNKGDLKTAEGITKYNKVEYSLSGWCENFTDYLRSAMSYTNSRTLDMYIGNVDWVVITQNAFNRFNK